jgi:Alginate export
MALSVVLVAFLASAAGAEPERPWRAHEELGVEWLRFGVEHRSRLEHLENDFRIANPGDATGFFMRTLLTAELRLLPFVMGAELADARAWTWTGTPLNPTLVNPLDLLQGYLGLRTESLLAEGDALSLTAGRMTLDLGSRRLVARNEYRNTINAFTGIDLQWTSPAHDVVRTFAVVPVVRLPADPEGLAENAIELDRENLDALLWAAFVQSRPLFANVTVEAFVLGLHERDGSLAPSSNRHLYTPGVRALRPPNAGDFDVQVELLGQLGWSRASPDPTDTTDLGHLAFAMHASAGFRFDVPWAPRPVLQFDYASGDASPDDESNNRFDPLFGARRFDFGPTGLYGAIARNNLSSPAIRLEVQPHQTVDAFTAYRLVWLASARDAWTPGPLRDPSGDSGSFVGQQLEARVRWHVVPRSLSFDLGGAVLVRGDFASHAPGAKGAPSGYVYSQITGTL